MKTLFKSFIVVFVSAALSCSFPQAAGAADSSDEYRLQPGDLLQITVYDEPTLTTEAKVSSNGDINYPLLGHISAAGISASELQTQLTTLLEADYLVNPQVQVSIKTYYSGTVSVTGSVNKPGSYSMVPGKPMLLMEAIAMSGGFAKGAAAGKIRIIRSENGETVTIDANAKEIIKGDKSKDIELKAADVIFVPESWL